MDLDNLLITINLLCRPCLMTVVYDGLSLTKTVQKMPSLQETELILTLLIAT